MKMRNFNIFTLALLLLSFRVHALTCDETKISLRDFQQKQDELTIKIGEEEKTRKEIEIERDKYLAQLLLLQGVEANIEAFNKSLEDIKSQVEGENLNMAQLLDLQDDRKVEDIAQSLTAHKFALENMKTTHDLLKIAQTSQFTAFARQAYHNLTGLDPNANAGITKEQRNEADRKWTDPNVVTGDALLSTFQETCRNGNMGAGPGHEEVDICAKINQLLNSGSPENQAQAGKIVKGFFGLMKRMDFNPRLLSLTGENATYADDEEGETTQTHQDYHQALIGLINKSIPTKVMEDDSYKAKTQELQDKLLALREAQAAVDKFTNDKATCRLQGKDNTACAEIKLAADVKDEIQAAIGGVETYLQDYATVDGDSDNSVLSAVKSKLAKLSTILDVDSEGTTAWKLLNQEGNLPVFKAAENFQKFYKDANFFDVLATRLKTQGEGFDDTKARLLNDLLKDPRLGCEMSTSIKDNAEQAFDKEMVGCLMKLRSATGVQARESLKKSLTDKVNEFDGQLDKIESGETFGKLEHLKKIAFNDFVQSCHDGNLSNPKLNCNSTDDSFPLEKKLTVLSLDVGDATHLINLHNKPGSVSLGGNEIKSFDEQVEINGICQGSTAADNPLCRSASGRIKRREENVRNIRRREGIRKKYTSYTLPDGSKVYKRRQSWWHQAGMAVAHTAKNWIPFAGTYYSNEYMMQANYDQAMFWKNYYGSIPQYSPYRYQLSSLVSPATFQFSQQPTTFRT